MDNALNVACGLTIASAPGESRTFKNGIDVFDLTQTLEVQMNALRAGASGQPQFHEFNLTLAFDKGAIKLYQLAAQGTPVPMATISYSVTRSGSALTVCQISLQSVTVTRAVLKNASGDNNNFYPLMEVGLAFQSIEISYNQLSSDGSNSGTVATGALSTVQSS